MFKKLMLLFSVALAVLAAPLTTTDVSFAPTLLLQSSFSDEPVEFRFVAVSDGTAETAVRAEDMVPDVSAAQAFNIRPESDCMCEIPEPATVLLLPVGLLLLSFLRRRRELLN